MCGSKFVIRIALVVVMKLAFAPCLSYAQEEKNFASDSLYSGSKELNTNSFLIETFNNWHDIVGFRHNQIDGMSIERSDYLQKMNLYPPALKTSNLSLFRGEYNTSGVIKQFENGAIIGLGSQRNLIGLGAVSNATFVFHHRFNDSFFMNASLNINKLRLHYFSNQSFEASALLSYRLNNNITLNAFGSYYIGSFPSFVSYSYGGYIDFNITNRFGTQLGVQRYYDPSKSSWNTVPIVVPYYKFNKVTVGMDFGGIMQKVVQDLIK